jgi:predicted DNA-binding mobile mystery protein A
MGKFTDLQHFIMPPLGWIKTIRTGIGMSMEQLGKKLSITKQVVMDIEKREKEGAITIKAMQEIANAMDMKFVYGFVPNAGSLELMIEKKALERATEIRNNTPKILWD